MTDVPRTPPETCRRAREQARRHGIRHVYSGNIHDAKSQSTYCPSCSATLIERDWYELGAYRLTGNRCTGCGTEIAGRFAAEGLGRETWGRKRLRVAIA